MMAPRDTLLPPGVRFAMRLIDLQCKISNPGLSSARRQTPPCTFPKPDGPKLRYWAAQTYGMDGY